MSKTNKDILYLIFEELQQDSKSLFSCLMVNRLWCETVIPILWRNPWCYKKINYSKKKYLFFIISCYLFDDIKEFITEQEIQLPSSSNQSLLFDYLSFCRSINVNVINNIISIGSSLAYNQFFMQHEFYYLFMKKCPEVKYFDMRSIKHQIFYFPEAKVHLESLSELKCDTSTDSSYFYGLSRYCQNIKSLNIVNMNQKPNYGIARLIEVQKKLKYFEWKDNFYEDYFSEDPYKEIFLALEKKAENLDHLRLFFKYVDGFENTLLQEILSKFYKLKILIFDDYYLYFTEKQLKQLEMQVYHELEILNLECNSLNVISSIIKNSGGRLKKVLFRPYDILDTDFSSDDFNDNSLNFIRRIYENCPYIEYLSITFPPLNDHFIEFEKLLKICQNLKSLLLIIRNADIIETNEKRIKNGEKLLKILIRSAPTNLKEIRFYDDFKFSLENLEEFLEKWKGRSALSILTIDYIYMQDDYTKLINKYKEEGVIKDFNHSLRLYEINYNRKLLT
jgi:hypothetical protein